MKSIKTSFVCSTTALSAPDFHNQQHDDDSLLLLPPPQTLLLQVRMMEASACRRERKDQDEQEEKQDRDDQFAAQLCADKKKKQQQQQPQVLRTTTTVTISLEEEQHSISFEPRVDSVTLLLASKNKDDDDDDNDKIMTLDILKRRLTFSSSSNNNKGCWTFPLSAEEDAGSVVGVRLCFAQPATTILRFDVAKNPLHKEIVVTLLGDSSNKNNTQDDDKIDFDATKTIEKLMEHVQVGTTNSSNNNNKFAMPMTARQAEQRGSLAKAALTHKLFFVPQQQGDDDEQEEGANSNKKIKFVPWGEFPQHVAATLLTLGVELRSVGALQVQLPLSRDGRPSEEVAVLGRFFNGKEDEKKQQQQHPQDPASQRALESHTLRALCEDVASTHRALVRM